MPVDFKDYYSVLGVARDAETTDIKKVFRKLARKFHPDVAKDKKSAEEKFKEINEAYEVLGDPEKRKNYDLLGANWQQGGGGQAARGRRTNSDGYEDFQFGGTGFSDFFERYFSGGGRAGSGHDFNPGSGATRGADIEGDIMVTLEEAMHGTQRTISLSSGAGGKSRSFEVRIPPGAAEGKRIRVPGQGRPGGGGAPAGDLYLRVRHAAHPDFQTEGADLYHELDLAPWEAALGADIKVPTLDGSVKLRISPGTENGRQLRVRGRGLPKGKTGERGDIYATVNIVIPTELTADERALWENLRTISKLDPRGG